MGDSCIDYYHFGTCDRLSPEAPVPIIKQEKVETREGMSLNVKNNLLSFGFKVDHLTNETPLEKRRIVDIKTNYQICRLDIDENLIVEQLDVANIDPSIYDCLVISDYDKGFISNSAATFLCDKFKNKPIFVDSKKKDLSIYTNCILKINESEYKNAIKIPNCSKIIVTLGERGAMYESKIFSTKKVDVHDVCGAGDVFISSLVYSFMKTKCLEKSISYANKLASVSVTKVGTYVLTREDINDFCI